MIVMLLLIQATTAGPTIPEALQAVRPCHTDSEADDIVVCGRIDPYRYRLKPAPQRADGGSTAIPRAAMKLGRGTLSADTDEASVGGFTATRASIKLTLPF